MPVCPIFRKSPYEQLSKRQIFLKGLERLGMSPSWFCKARSARWPEVRGRPAASVWMFTTPVQKNFPSVDCLSMSTVFGGLGIQQVKVWKAITQDTYQLAKFVLGRGCLSFFVKNIPLTPLIPYIPHLGRGCLRNIPYESPLPRLWWLRWRVIRVNAQAMLGTPRGCLGVRARKISRFMEYHGISPLD